MARRKIKLCAVVGCCTKHYCGSYCRKHYSRFKRHGDPLKGRAAMGSLGAYVNDVVLKYTGDDCLRWPFACKNDYPDVYVGGRVVRACRYVCTRTYGDPPTNKHQTAHSCGNSKRVNPNHLRWATAKENIADKLLHGTDGRGERNVKAKLTKADVLAIRAAEGTISVSMLAKKYGIATSHAYNILTRKTWVWLEDNLDA